MAHLYMVYPLKMVIFHGYVSHNQRVINSNLFIFCAEIHRTHPHLLCARLGQNFIRPEDMSRASALRTRCWEDLMGNRGRNLGDILKYILEISWTYHGNILEISWEYHGNTLTNTWKAIEKSAQKSGLVFMGFPKSWILTITCIYIYIHTYIHSIYI